MSPKSGNRSPLFPSPSVTEETASFVDLAPTLLSLLDIPKPAQMQGRAFLGDQREDSAKDDYVFLFADRFVTIYGMRRGLTDGRWKYIRRFTPQYPAAPYGYYQFGQKGWTAWQKAWREGTLESPYNQIWEKNQAVEELFDTQSDPWEIKNLADDPAHAAQLEKMRGALKNEMAAILDTGIIPEPMFAELAPKHPSPPTLKNIATSGLTSSTSPSLPHSAKSKTCPSSSKSSPPKTPSNATGLCKAASS